MRLTQRRPCADVVLSTLAFSAVCRRALQQSSQLQHHHNGGLGRTVPHGAGRSKYILRRDDSRDGFGMNVDADEFNAGFMVAVKTLTSMSFPHESMAACVRR